MADDQDFLSSPIAQLLIPLAATAASAISPRYGGAGAQAGLGALGAMQSYRLQDIAQRRKQREEDDWKKLMSDPRSPESGPAGGQGPGTVQAIQTQTTEAASGGYGGGNDASNAGPAQVSHVPRPGSTNFSGDTRRLAALLGPSKGPEFLADLAKKDTPAPKTFDQQSHVFQNEYNDTVRDVYDPNTGTQKQFYMGGSPPAKPTTASFDQQAYDEAKAADPTLTKMAFIKQLREQPPKDSYQQAADAEGNALIFNSKTGSYAPARGLAPGTKMRTPGTGGNIFTPEDAKAVADAIQSGNQPPNTQGLYRNAAPVRAELAKRGFDLSNAQTDWNAVQKHVSTMNGQQQERLRQALSFAHDSLDQVEDLYGQWTKIAPSVGFKALNHAELKAAQQVPGEAGAVASALETQINHMVSEVGQLYMGGNSPTDHALKLAANTLSADWNPETFTKQIQQLRRNLEIRRNSMMNSAPAGVSPNSPYIPQTTGPQGQQAQPAPSGPVSKSGRPIKQNAQGQWVYAD